MSRFRRRLMGLSALRQALKDDFVRVEYLENISNAYIQTNIIPNAGTGLKTKAYFTDSRDVYFVGLRNDGGNTRWGIGHGGAGFYYCYGNYQGTNRLVDTKGEFYLNYKNDKKFITIDLDDSSTLTSNLPNLSFTPKFGIRIFGAAGSGANTIVKSRIYYLQITQGSEIIRDFIPMYQISTDTYGLWDRVTEEFYTSPNGVKFTGGREVIDEDYVLMDYIENPSTAYLNTRVNFYTLSPSKYININLEVLEAKSQWSTVYGARYKSNDVDSIIIQTSNNNKWYTRQAGAGFYLSLPIVGKHNFKLVDGHNYVDNVPFSDKYPIPRYSGAYMCLLGTNNLQTNTVTDLGLHCKIFDCQIGNGNELVRDYVPVRQISSGKYGLYDKINGNFISSANSVEFISVE